MAVLVVVSSDVNPEEKKNSGHVHVGTDLPAIFNENKRFNFHIVIFFLLRVRKLN